MEGRSQVECEVRLAEISPQSVPLREKERVLTPVLTEVKFVMTTELKQKLEPIRELDSHANPHPTYAELFMRMADRVLKQIDPERPQPERKPKQKLERKPVGEPEQKLSANPDLIARKNQPIPRAKHQERAEPENKNSNISTLPASRAAPMASVQQWSSLVQSALVRAQASAPLSSSSSGPGFASSEVIQIFIHSDFLSSPRRRNSSGPFRQTTFSERPSRTIPAVLRRAVWKRDGGACTFISSSPSLRSLVPLLPSGIIPTPEKPIPERKSIPEGEPVPEEKRCGSRFQIELDHILPFAQGGPSTLENLRCVCRAHNTWLAVQAYGPEKMATFRR